MVILTVLPYSRAMDFRNRRHLCLIIKSNLGDCWQTEIMQMWHRVNFIICLFLEGAWKRARALKKESPKSPIFIYITPIFLKFYITVPVLYYVLSKFWVKTKPKNGGKWPDKIAIKKVLWLNLNFPLFTSIHLQRYLFTIKLTIFDNSYQKIVTV